MSALHRSRIISYETRRTHHLSWSSCRLEPTAEPQATSHKPQARDVRSPTPVALAKARLDTANAVTELLEFESLLGIWMGRELHGAGKFEHWLPEPLPRRHEVVVHGIPVDDGLSRTVGA